MREAAPIGMPKLIVSTVASGETGPLVGETDITMMYSVVDIAGNNALLRTVFGNAAAAMLGMASNYASTKGLLRSDKRFRVGITMFGVTTPGVDAIRKHLEQHHDVEVFVFHATGHGGRAMERLVRSGEIDAIVDVTTTEICDHLMGGNMSAGAERLEAALESGIPTIISLGATDMVNFGPKQSVPERYGERHLYEHNPTITLMRTTPVECEKIGKFIVDKIQHHARNHKSVQVWIPTGGISMMAVPGGAFYDERADDALFMTLKMGLSPIPITVVEDDRDINDPGFAVDIADALMKMAR
ncbi:Hypothetical protein D9617_15g041490 [Elsinoe fawcettii]|nr:Hypothetical protein D9617_15g041490 [Elsinoe fawcettii]